MDGRISTALRLQPGKERILFVRSPAGPEVIGDVHELAVVGQPREEVGDQGWHGGVSCAAAVSGFEDH